MKTNSAHHELLIEPTHSIPTIQRCYARLLEESNNRDEREYSEDADQIREVLIHAHYLSQKDIEICAAFDCQALAKSEMNTNADEIESLIQSLRASDIKSLHQTLRATEGYAMSGPELRTRRGR